MLERFFFWIFRRAPKSPSSRAKRSDLYSDTVILSSATACVPLREGSVFYPSSRAKRGDLPFSVLGIVMEKIPEPQGIPINSLAPFFCRECGPARSSTSLPPPPWSAVVEVYAEREFPSSRAKRGDLHSDTVILSTATACVPLREGSVFYPSSRAKRGDLPFSVLGIVMEKYQNLKEYP